MDGDARIGTLKGRFGGMFLPRLRKGEVLLCAEFAEEAGSRWYGRKQRPYCLTSQRFIIAYGQRQGFPQMWRFEGAIWTSAELPLVHGVTRVGEADLKNRAMIRVAYRETHVDFRSEAPDLWIARFAEAKRAETGFRNDVPPVWQESLLRNWLWVGLAGAAIGVWLLIDLARWIT